MAVVRSPDFLRALIRETALATLIHQRRLTPSCGGHAPTAERTVGPARMIAESLTPKPGIREQYLRIVRAASRSEPVRDSEVVLLVDRVQHRACRLLDDLVFECGHSPIELHFYPISLWVRLR